MKLPNISILIVSRNDESGLKRLFNSMKKLNYPKRKLEIVFVDDGSSDNSSEVARKFGARIYRFEERQGRARVRNFALKKAKSKIIAWIDSDCEIKDRNWLQNMLKHIDGDVIGVAGTQLKPPTGLSRIAWYLPGLALVTKKEKLSSWAPTTSSLFLKKPLLDIGGFDKNLVTAEDLEICWRLSKKGYRFKQIPEAKIIHNFRTTFSGFIKQQYERGIYGGTLARDKKGFLAKFLNSFLYIFLIGITFAIFYPILILLAFAFPLIFYTDLYSMYFLPKIVFRYFKEEKSLTGIFKLVALAYIRNFALALGLLTYQIKHLKFI